MVSAEKWRNTRPVLELRELRPVLEFRFCTRALIGYLGSLSILAHEVARRLLSLTTSTPANRYYTRRVILSAHFHLFYTFGLITQQNNIENIFE